MLHNFKIIDACSFDDVSASFDLCKLLESSMSVFSP